MSTFDKLGLPFTMICVMLSLMKYRANTMSIKSITTPDLKRIINKAFVDQYNEPPEDIRVVRYRATCGGYIKVFPSANTMARINEKGVLLTSFGRNRDKDFRTIQEVVFAKVKVHIPWLKKEEVTVIFRPVGLSLTNEYEYVEIILNDI